MSGTWDKGKKNEKAESRCLEMMNNSSFKIEVIEQHFAISKLNILGKDFDQMKILRMQLLQLPFSGFTYTNSTGKFTVQN